MMDILISVFGVGYGLLALLILCAAQDRRP